MDGLTSSSSKYTVVLTPKTRECLEEITHNQGDCMYAFSEPATQARLQNPLISQGVTAISVGWALPTTSNMRCPA